MQPGTRRDENRFMQVVINGSQTTLEDIHTTADLVKHLDLTGRIAIEINNEIVPGSRFAEFRLTEGDRIEIVQAIGGG